MKKQRLRILLFVNLFSLAGYYVFAPLYALYAHNLDITPKTISLIWSGYSLLMAIFILIFGKLENVRNKAKAMIIGYFIYALGAYSFLLVHSESMLVAVLAFNAVGGGIALPAYMTMFAKNESKGKESEQWSWLDGGNMFATALGAAIGGLVVGAFGFRGVFITMGTIQLLAAFIAYRQFYSS